MKTLKVELGKSSYPVFIGSDVIQQFNELVSLYRFPENSALIFQDGSTAQFIPRSDSFHRVKLPKNVHLADFGAVNKFYAGLPWAEFDSGITFVAVGDEPLLNLAAFSCGLLLHPPVLILIPTTSWAMIECGVRSINPLGCKNHHAVLANSSRPHMVLVDLHSLQNTDGDEIFLLHSSLLRNLLLSKDEGFSHYEDAWQKIGLEDEDLLFDFLERVCEIRQATLTREGVEPFLLEDFGLRALRCFEAQSGKILPRREMACLIFLELRWRLKIAGELKIGDPGESGSSLLLIEKILALNHVKQGEWDKARDRFLQSIESNKLSDIHLPKAIGAMRRVKEIDRKLAESCLANC